MLARPRPSRFRIALRILPALAPFATTACSSTPTSPLEISQLSLGAAYDVYVEGERAYVSNNRGIAIIDIGNIHGPRRTTLLTENSSSGIKVDGLGVNLGVVIRW